jgi:copper homeostasis protein
VLEVIACTVEDARNAEAGGADRLEVVRELDRDGLTPDLETVKRMREAVSIPLHVMIRPRDTFTGYSAADVRAMRRSLRALKEAGADGAVMGFLTKHGEIDLQTLQEVLTGTEGMSITFHRAFDHVRDPRRALLDLIEGADVHRILTSGTAPSALEGMDMLADLSVHAKERIVLMAGAGITVDTLPLLVRRTGLREFHIGRGVRTPPTHDGTVDSDKLRHIAALARSLTVGGPS